MSDLVAFRVEINSLSCIVAAQTRPKAQWIATRAYWEAGYGSRGLWPRAVAHRAPRFDFHPTLLRDPTKAYTEESLR